MGANIKIFDQVQLLEDINSVIVKGMIGTVVEIFDFGMAFEVEFIKDDGTCFSYQGQITFTIPLTKLRKI